MMRPRSPSLADVASTVHDALAQSSAHVEQRVAMAAQSAARAVSKQAEGSQKAFESELLRQRTEMTDMRRGLEDVFGRQQVETLRVHSSLGQRQTAVEEELRQQRAERERLEHELERLRRENAAHLEQQRLMVDEMRSSTRSEVQAGMETLQTASSRDVGVLATHIEQQRAHMTELQSNMSSVLQMVQQLATAKCNSDAEQRAYREATEHQVSAMWDALQC